MTEVALEGAELELARVVMERASEKNEAEDAAAELRQRVNTATVETLEFLGKRLKTSSAEDAAEIGKAMAELAKSYRMAEYAEGLGAVLYFISLGLQPVAALIQKYVMDELGKSDGA